MSLLEEIDFRFIEIEYELSVLDDYIKLLEEQLGGLIEREQRHFDVKIQKEIYQIDEAERQVAYQEFYEHTESLLPHFFRNPFLVTLWATFESAIIEIAEYLRTEKRLRLRINDIRGQSFLAQAQKYYDHILNFSLCIKPEPLGRIEMLRILRNAVAHSNSRINAIKSDDDRKKIEAWVNQKIGISLKFQTLIFSEKFIKEAYHIMNETLTDLLGRVRESYPNQNFKQERARKLES